MPLKHLKPSNKDNSNILADECNFMADLYLHYGCHSKGKNQKHHLNNSLLIRNILDIRRHRLMLMHSHLIEKVFFQVLFLLSKSLESFNEAYLIFTDCISQWTKWNIFSFATGFEANYCLNWSTMFLRHSDSYVNRSSYYLSY